MVFTDLRRFAVRRFRDEDIVTSLIDDVEMIAIVTYTGKGMLSSESLTVDLPCRMIDSPRWTCFSHMASRIWSICLASRVRNSKLFPTASFSRCRCSAVFG